MLREDLSTTSSFEYGSDTLAGTTLQNPDESKAPPTTVSENKPRKRPREEDTSDKNEKS
ncbi:102_t:CDS:2 [Ambispora gerdemannii]|uniref:102_t:CDS:1 n=1 Tax=Ambispora gerdemannii TaxID=144530 RepID=A0A9N8VD07_9GLOM|nr:102_t:CDS:2 [Ambispora gerdemannii]